MLEGLDLAPGEVLDDLRFGVHWPDWTPWTTPFLPEVPSSVHWIQATRNVSEPAATIPTPPAILRLEGRRERPDPNLHALRLRITSPTNTTGFRIRLPLEIPAGLDPVLEAWWPQGCQGSIGTGQLELSCPTALLQAGSPWPDSTGAAIGIHDRNWTPWPVGATGLSSLPEFWTEVSP